MNEIDYLYKLKEETARTDALNELINKLSYINSMALGHLIGGLILDAEKIGEKHE